MSQPSEVQTSQNKRKRRLLAIFGFIAIIALSLGLALTAYPSLYLAQTTINTCQQTSTIFTDNSATTTTMNNCEQNQVTGPAPLGGVTVVSSTASHSSSAATTVVVTTAVITANTPVYHPKLTNGEGSIGLPGLVLGDPPALASPTMISGVFTIRYGDGSTAVLSTNQVTLDLCAASCVSVPGTLKQTSPGTYAYTFTPPSLKGTVKVYIAAGSLTDEWGRILPNVDTQIGTYTTATPPTAGTSQQPATSAPPAGTPPPRLTNQAVSTNQNPPTTTPVKGLLVTLSALTVAGTLLILPVKRRGPKKDEDAAP